MNTTPKRPYRIVILNWYLGVACCIALVLPGCISQRVIVDQQQSQTSSMTIWEARRAVITGLKTVSTRTDWASMGGAGDNVNMHPQSIRVSAESIEFEANLSTWGSGTTPDPRTLTCKFDLKNINPFGVYRYRSQYWLNINGRSGIGCEINSQTLAWKTPYEAQKFVNAVNCLRSSARGEDLDANQTFGNDFRQKVVAWRALPVKPTISEEIRKQQLLAENAVKEKQFDVAIEEYEAGLAINPIWPEGHFNAALLCAELHYYTEAIKHMQAYLELVPDAADAQSARDQMMIWQSKMKR